MRDNVLMGKIFKKAVAVLMYLITLVYIAPFYICIVYSLKNREETALSPIGLPAKIHFENYIRAVEVSSFFNALKNSFIVTVFSVIIIIIASSMAAYIISRYNNKFYNVIYYLFLASIMLPFQVIMFPFYKMMFNLHLINTLPGLIIALAGINLGFNFFLYTGFVKTVPRSMEESAVIDGCSLYRTFWQIIFPLLKPINVTVIILSALGCWNDFQTSLILVQKKNVSTLPLVQYYFMGQYSSELNMAFAAIILSMIPILLFYLFAQKHIIRGVTAGAVKG